MAKQVTYSIGPVVGCGRTKTEARENAERAAADWLQRMQDDGVIVLTHGAFTRVIVPQQDGTASYSENGCSSYSGDTDTGRVVRRHALHLAQLAWDGETAEPPADLAWRFSQAEMADWYGWVAWQQSYKHFRSIGLSDMDARHHISGMTHLVSDEGRSLVDANIAAQSVA